VTQFLILVFAVVVSVDTIAGEVASGTIHTVVTKPVSRRSVILGKFGGHVLAVSAFGLALALGAVAVAKVIGDYTPPRLGIALGLMVLEGIVVLSVSYLGGVFMGTLANGMVVFMLYAMALVGAWVERIGAFTGNVSAQYVGIVASLIMPTEALWQRAAWEMLPPVLRETLGRTTPFTAANPPSDRYAVVALALAVRRFGRRDL
jgi:ABC-type transport system involved in multi-copper enzyme maturation permease subunit